MTFRTLLIFTLIALSLGCGKRAHTARQNSATFRHAAVAADHATASAAGAEILAKGGNAVDAAVATSFALSVVRPYSCGIGGGGFMVIKFNNDPVHGNLATAINYRETCPAAIGPDFYEKIDDPDAATRGAKAVAVPGSVAGVLYALEKYGTLDRATVLAPAIRAAEEGFVVDEHYIFSITDDLLPYFQADPSRKDRFSFIWKRFLREGKVQVGDRIRVPEQAAALRAIARDGATAFYQGEIADEIVATIARDGGVITKQDLADYTVREVEPLRFYAFGRSILAMPPPSSGGTTLCAVLGILQRKGDFRLSDRHYLVEALKQVFADRSRWIADPDFNPVPVERLLDPAYLDELARRAQSPTTRPAETYGSIPEDGGTSHWSVVDSRGNAVACTETINLIFGSCLVVEKYGFVLNDQMDDFTTRRGQANAFNLVQSDRNAPRPGMRGLSSMSPTIVLDANDHVEVIAGASGGPRIISSTLQAILHVILEDKTAGEALEARRIHHQWQPEILYAEEEALAPEEAADLTRRGHTIERAKAIGNAQLIRRAKAGTGWDAACDPRKGGKPAGF